MPIEWRGVFLFIFLCINVYSKCKLEEMANSFKCDCYDHLGHFLSMDLNA